LLAVPEQNGLLCRIAEYVDEPAGGVLDSFHAREVALPIRTSRLWR
jgi:hypothetical protein